MRSALKATYLAKQEVVSRAPQVYAITGVGGIDLFTVVGGPVWVTGLFAYANTAVAAAADWTLTASGVGLDTGAAGLNLLVGEGIVWPLQGADPAVGMIEYQTVPTPAAFAREAFGFVWAPGSGAATGDTINLILTVGTGGTVSFYIVFTRMNEWSEVIVG